MQRLDTTRPIWERVFMVAPLVLVGTRNLDGQPNLAPKHMAGPMSWDNFFGFVCAPRHATWKNASRLGTFAVSYPRPQQILQTALAASPCRGDSPKADILGRLPLLPGPLHGDPLLQDASLHLELVS